MNKRFSAAAAVVAAVSVLLSGCNSDESPTELDMLIEQLQTVQLTSETEPEEIPEDEPENTEESITSVSSEETPEETAEPENTEEVPEDTTESEDTEETSDTSDTSESSEPTEDNDSGQTTYKSLTVTVITVVEDYILVELDGVVYKAFFDDSTGIYGGEILKDKTVTITYATNDDGSVTDIYAAAITVLP